ncbi:MAG: PilX N-terminal domain-containing pilus assembly protein [Colwellia sp.]
MMINNLPKQSAKSHLKHQKGVVLVVTLVFLTALTAVAAALMQNSTSDMKISGASEDRAVAIQEAVSAVDEVIYNQVSPGATNNFAQSMAKYPINTGLLPATKTNATASLDVTNNDFGLETDCPHTKLASSSQVFSCNILRIQINRKYGRTNKSDVNVNSGIAQQLLK